jgi:serine phosphatase RsbU (regulator of sigma subunit)
MTAGNIDILRNLPFLEGSGPDMVERLAELAVEKRFQPDQIIFQEGSTGADMYLIIEGLVEVVKGEGAEEMVLAKRGPGDMFGEMGLIEASPRFATIRVLEPSRLFEFSEQAMRSLFAEEPQLLYRTVQVLSARLRESDLQMIEDLQRKNQELARAYRELKEAQAALVEKERLERELELARDLQRSILPLRFPDLPGVRCGARYRPARQVGGDFYDVVPLADGCVGLVMADVSDKGMAAALYMALARSLIRAEAKRSTSPRLVLLSAHKLLLEMSRANMFVTVFYGVVDPVRGTLCYARAGHDHPMLVTPSTGQCQLLTGDGMLLGFVEEVILEEEVVDMHPGDLLVLYTDGITDAPSPDGEFFGKERLREAVCATGELSAQAMCDHVFERVADFQAGAVQFDDMALLVATMGAVD